MIIPQWPNNLNGLFSEEVPADDLLKR